MAEDTKQLDDILQAISYKNCILENIKCSSDFNSIESHIPVELHDLYSTYKYNFPKYNILLKNYSFS